jgi:hypothetical protein
MMGDVSRLGYGRNDGLLDRILSEFATSAECVGYFGYDGNIELRLNVILLAFDSTQGCGL